MAVVMPAKAASAKRVIRLNPKNAVMVRVIILVSPAMAVGYPLLDEQRLPAPAIFRCSLGNNRNVYVYTRIHALLHAVKQMGLVRYRSQVDQEQDATYIDG